jgi:hypothetical protein
VNEDTDAIMKVAAAKTIKTSRQKADNDEKRGGFAVFG